MLYSVNELTKYEIAAKDGNIGQVRGFYFDLGTWEIHYLVVDTSKWLPGRRVLVSPVEIRQLNDLDESLVVDLTKDQIKNSPAIEEDAPIARSLNDLNAYYGWRSRPSTSLENVDADEDTELRSTAEVIDFYVEADDGDIGHVEDFLVDNEDWTIRYAVIHTANWLPGKKVLIAADWADDIGWDDKRFHVSMTRDQIKNSPEYDSSTLPERQYEEELYHYYRRPGYWQHTGHAHPETPMKAPGEGAGRF